MCLSAEDTNIWTPEKIFENLGCLKLGFAHFEGSEIENQATKIKHLKASVLNKSFLVQNESSTLCETTIMFINLSIIYYVPCSSFLGCYLVSKSTTLPRLMSVPQ